MADNWYRSRSLFTPPPRPKRPKKKWRIRYILWNALKRTCMVLGAFMLLSAFIGVIISGSAVKSAGPAPLPDKMVLYFPVEDVLLEHENQLAPLSFTEKSLTSRDLIRAIDHAATDTRVKGFVARLKGGTMSLSQVEEIRAAVARFRESGKFAYIYASSYESIGSYYFASAFEEVWLQPMGLVSVSGINAEMPFARELLDKIGVEPQVFARKEYKNFFEAFTSKEMSEATRESMGALVADLGNTMLEGISASRGIDPAVLKREVDKGFLLDDEAREASLIDAVNFMDGFNEKVKEIVTGDRFNDEKIFVEAGRYVRDIKGHKDHLPIAPAATSNKPKVALVYAVGNIVERGDGRDLAATDKIAGTLQDVIDDDDIKAVVLRVDSPGGDPTAAEALRYAITKVQKNNKKVIVSMGSAAASGGYWISAPADYIFALPMTLTGSIGVTGGKFSMLEMWEKLGVNWDRIQWGDNAALRSFNRPFSEAEAARMNALMDDVYENFIALVAEGRNMSVAEVDAMARGRVWTGLSAKRLGLVDELGGLDAALDYAAAQVGAVDRNGVNVVVLPKPKSSFERVIEFLEVQASIGGLVSANRDALVRLGDFLEMFKSETAGPVSATANVPRL